MDSSIPIDIEAAFLQIMETAPNDPEAYIAFVRTTSALLLEKYSILREPNLRVIPEDWIERARSRRNAIAGNVGTL
jgi:hypothetical protein